MMVDSGTGPAVPKPVGTDNGGGASLGRNRPAGEYKTPNRHRIAKSAHSLRIEADSYRRKAPCDTISQVLGTATKAHITPENRSKSPIFRKK